MEADFLLAARERADAFDRAAVLEGAEEPLRALADDCALADDFDLLGALLLTVSKFPCPIEVRPCPKDVTLTAAAQGGRRFGLGADRPAATGTL